VHHGRPAPRQYERLLDRQALPGEARGVRLEGIRASLREVVCYDGSEVLIYYQAIARLAGAAPPVRHDAERFDVRAPVCHEWQVYDHEINARG
jgi:hypothetical protein